MNSFLSWALGQPPPVSEIHRVPDEPLAAFPPLDPDRESIRLLKISDGEGGKVASCSLRTYLLSDKPSYTALSYVWGNPPGDDPHQVTVNGFPMAVGLNLAAFLIYYICKYSLRSWCKPLLWIDALCIDQENEGEKASQVRMMGDIYSAAHNVCVWLGVPTKGEDRASFDKLWSWRGPEWGPIYRPSAGTTKDNAYWNRMWVVQEVKCAKRIFFACGHRVATAEQFRTTITKETHSCSWLFDSSLKRRQTSLLQWIDRLKEFRCSDVRDKIWAIQNLVTEEQKIEVSYEVSIRELYLLVMDRQYGDLRAKSYQEIRWLNTILAGLIFNITESKWMNFGWVTMPTIGLSHLKAQVHTVIDDTHNIPNFDGFKSFWPREKRSSYAFTLPICPLANDPEEESDFPPVLSGIPDISIEYDGKSTAIGTCLEQIYVAVSQNGSAGFATAGIRHGDLLCRIDGLQRVSVVVRPFLYVAETLDYGTMSESMLKEVERDIKRPLENDEKLLFIPTMPDGKATGGIWLSHEIVGIALEAKPPQGAHSRTNSVSIESCNRHALYNRFVSMKVSLYLDQIQVLALRNFATAYCNLNLDFHQIYELGMTLSNNTVSPRETDKPPEDRYSLIHKAVENGIMQSDSEVGQSVRVAKGLPADYSEFSSLLAKARASKSSERSSLKSSRASFGSASSETSNAGEDSSLTS